MCRLRPKSKSPAAAAPGAPRRWRSAIGQIRTHWALGRDRRGRDAGRVLYAWVPPSPRVRCRKAFVTYLLAGRRSVSESELGAVTAASGPLPVSRGPPGSGMRRARRVSCCGPVRPRKNSTICYMMNVVYRAGQRRDAGVRCDAVAESASRLTPSDSRSSHALSSARRPTLLRILMPSPPRPHCRTSLSGVTRRLRRAVALDGDRDRLALQGALHAAVSRWNQEAASAAHGGEEEVAADHRRVAVV